MQKRRKRPSLSSFFMPATGIEPVRCRHHRILSPARLPVPPRRHIKWMEVDSNHRSNLQQIYSLSPLATRESIHMSVCPDSHILWHNALHYARRFFIFLSFLEILFCGTHQYYRRCLRQCDVQPAIIYIIMHRKQ